MFRLSLLLFFIFFTPFLLKAQIDTSKAIDSINGKKTIEQLKYKQQPGLALAASKIFFSEKPYSFSGFGEASFVQYTGDKYTGFEDLELYYTDLYRLATFFGYRFSQKIIWNSEFQIEYLRNGNQEDHTEIVIEAFTDFLIHDKFKARFGFYPLPIGYVNNNDEPVMFYSVNRSEVERLITPSTWIELGAMFYGNVVGDLDYALGISQGINAGNYLSGSWIRQGREMRLDVPQSLSFNPQLNYTGIPNTTLSISAYIGETGQGAEIEVNGERERVRAPLQLYTGYAKYEYENLTFTTVGTYGQLGETDRIYELTQAEQNTGQVIGRETFGYLAEVGLDILHYFQIKQKNKRFYKSEEVGLPIFARYERLNTHFSIHQNLRDAIQYPRVVNDLEIWTVGINFKPRKNIVLKANYQFRNNFAENPAHDFQESDRIEFGIGFIY